MIARDELAEEPLVLERVAERPARWEVGKSSEERRSPRRRTLAAVRILEGPELGGGLVATDLSADGAFLRAPAAVAPDVRFRLSLEIPTDPKPIVVTARAVRSSPARGSACASRRSRRATAPGCAPTPASMRWTRRSSASSRRSATSSPATCCRSASPPRSGCCSRTWSGGRCR